MEQVKLTKEFYDEFYKWLELDIEAVTWQGRFAEEFEQFWSLFFIEGLNINKMNSRFGTIIKLAKVGPLIAWFQWLRHKFYCFCFIKFDFSILDLSKRAEIQPYALASILREFFCEHFPQLEDYFNDRLQVGNLASKNINLSFKDIKNECELEEFPKGSMEDEILTSMEVTLFPEWREILKFLKRDFFSSTRSKNSDEQNKKLRVGIRLLGEVALLSLIGLIVIFLIQNINKWYESELVKQIGIYEPKFLWLDKDLKYETQQKNIAAQAQVSPDFDEIENMAAKNIPKEFQEEERFDTESEVTLTSWDSLPKDFEAAGLEQSQYEELKKGGFRDTRFGNKKAFRVMMKTVDAINSRRLLNELIEKYQVEKGDKVRPGTFVPGGLYYNLFVPIPYLKEFMAQVMDTGESILYESRTRARNPPGMSRVFIWIKSI